MNALAVSYRCTPITGNSSKGKRERFGRILQMHANHREEISEVYTGDIVAAVGLKDTSTGDTLCDSDHEIILESMVFPEPVIDVAIEPKTKAGQEKMSVALQKLAEEDPTFRTHTDEETGQTIISGMGELHLDIIIDRMLREFKVEAALQKLAEEDPTFRTHTDEETGQTIISGMGELHLDIIIDRMLREFKVEANIGKPQVAYKETITKKVDAEGKFARQSGGRGQYGHCLITLETLEAGAGYVFENKTVGGSIPKEYIGPIDQGIQEAMLNGVLAGYPVLDFKATVYDGSYHSMVYWPVTRY